MEREVPQTRCRGSQQDGETITKRLFGKVDALVFPLLVLACLVLGTPTVLAGDYAVGPQDKLKIRVFEWRPVTGTAFEWTPLHGEFEVSAGGNLLLPIIGALTVSGKTTEQIAGDIGNRLKAGVGLQASPPVSVEVSEYRPLFVTGEVQRPGRYSYSPGMVVIQALSLAGGPFRAGEVDLLMLQQQALSNRGDLQTFEVERLGLLARQARLDAVLSNKTSVVFPSELATKAGRPVVDRMMREEQQLFDARLNSTNAAIDSLTQAKKLALSQVDTLKSKSALLGKQIEMANKELSAVNKLFTQGLAASPRQLGALQDVSELESRSLDTSLALLKAQQDAATADRDIADLRNHYHVDALTEAAEVRARLAEISGRMSTATALLENIEVQAPAVAAQETASDGKPTFAALIDRAVDGKVSTIAASDNDPVEPGDVIRLVRRRQNVAETAAALSSATH